MSVHDGQKERIPPGLVRCGICGEFSGTTFEKYLARNAHYDPDRRVSALCRCHGPFCRVCGVNRIPRPISERYYEDLNIVLHVPHFAAGAPCESCASRQRLEALRTTQASLGESDKAVHIPCELRPGNSSRCYDFHTFNLSSGRSVRVSAVFVMQTYVSLVSGVPSADSDAELILEARERVRILWGERPTHVILPDYECAMEDGRTFLRMPPLQYCAWLESGPLRGSEKECSQLVVIWFGRSTLYVGLLELVERSLQSLPWEQLAGGCDR